MLDQRLRRGTKAFAMIAALLLPMSGTALGEVYKTVDADGNVTYTDQPPGPDAKPLELRELSVVERPEYNVRPKSDDSGDAEQQDPREVFRQLQRDYRDFRIVSPTPEQSLWGTANTATVAWDTGTSLQDGMKVRIYVDDEAATTTTQALYQTSRLDRGEHNVRAELLDAANQVVAVAGPVTFFIHQATVN